MADADENHNNEDGDAAQEQEINDNDSALGSEPPSSTQSLSSTICNYTYENGRRYHAYRAGNYFMPNDEQEQDYMDLWHHISTMILEGELFRAPIVNPQNILDVGTGTGIWAIDVADMFPNTHVIATDLSPIQPTWVPPNVQFQIDDCESEWNFNHSFDFVHIRNMSGSIADWPKLFSQAFAHLKPGGWLEASNIEAWGQSYNSSIPRDSASVEWQEKLRGAATTVGRELNIGPDLYRLVSSAGFVDVKDDIHKVNSLFSITSARLSVN
jgi:trans-aconitate methyltransferase